MVVGDVNSWVCYHCAVARFSPGYCLNVTNSLTDQTDEDFSFPYLTDEIRTTDVASMRSYCNSKGRAFN